MTSTVISHKATLDALQARCQQLRDTRSLRRTALSAESTGGPRTAEAAT